MDISTKASRIKYVRKLARMTQDQFGTALGQTRGAVGNWELGKGIKAANLEAIADKFGISVDWLSRRHGPTPTSVGLALHADVRSEDVAAALPTPPQGRVVKIKGYVGAGSEAHFYALADEDYEEVPAPAGASDRTVAVEIRGKSMGPLLSSWLVFYDDVRSPVTDDLIGQLCVVGLADDRILVKEIRQNGRGGFRLLSNANEPPVDDVKIEWAAKVTDMRPR